MTGTGSYITLLLTICERVYGLPWASLTGLHSLTCKEDKARFIEQPFLTSTQYMSCLHSCVIGVHDHVTHVSSCTGAHPSADRRGAGPAVADGGGGGAAGGVGGHAAGAPLQLLRPRPGGGEKG